MFFVGFSCCWLMSGIFLINYHHVSWYSRIRWWVTHRPIDQSIVAHHHFRACLMGTRSPHGSRAGFFCECSSGNRTSEAHIKVTSSKPGKQLAMDFVQSSKERPTACPVVRKASCVLTVGGCKWLSNPRSCLTIKCFPVEIGYLSLMIVRIPSSIYVY